jgi:hypothetical protein
VGHADDRLVVEESALHGMDDSVTFHAVKREVERAAELGGPVGLLGIVERLIVAFEAVGAISRVVCVPAILMDQGGCE